MKHDIHPHVFKPEDWVKLPPRERHLHAIALWAATLPASDWQALPVPQVDGVYAAVRMQTGRILTGRTRAFRPEMMRRLALDPKYGPGVAWVQAGD